MLDLAQLMQSFALDGAAAEDGVPMPLSLECADRGAIRVEQGGHGLLLRFITETIETDPERRAEAFLYFSELGTVLPVYVGLSRSARIVFTILDHEAQKDRTAAVIEILGRIIRYVDGEDR